jgi:hypothetical protein
MRAAALECGSTPHVSLRAALVANERCAPPADAPPMAGCPVHAGADGCTALPAPLAALPSCTRERRQLGSDLRGECSRRVRQASLSRHVESVLPKQFVKRFRSTETRAQCTCATPREVDCVVLQRNSAWVFAAVQVAPSLLVRPRKPAIPSDDVDDTNYAPACNFKAGIYRAPTQAIFAQRAPWPPLRLSDDRRTSRCSHTHYHRAAAVPRPNGYADWPCLKQTRKSRPARGPPRGGTPIPVRGRIGQRAIFPN